MRLAVIGATAAGPAAAAEASREGAEVVLFEQSEHVSVGACEIPYYVAGQLKGGANDLEVLTPEAFASSRGVAVHTQHRVVSLDPHAGRLVAESLVHGSRHEERFDRFILATGARAKRLGVEGEDAAGVFVVRSLASAVAIKAWVDTEPVRHAVIAGGGFVGLEMAEALHDRGIRVTILEPRGHVLAKVLSEPMVPLLQQAVHAAGVRVRGERITHIEADRHGRVRYVGTNRGERIGCQLVIVAIGLTPRTELARAAGVALGDTGAVAVDDRMRTNVRSVWACGDLIEVPRVVDGKKIHWPLAPVGRRTARVAARNAAGRQPPDRFNGITGSIAVKAFGVEVAQVGLSLEDALAAGFEAVTAQVQHWSRVSVYPGAKRLHVRYVVERRTGRLLGGELVGEEGAALRADVLVPLIRHERTVQEIAQDLDLVYNPPVAPATDPLKVAASVAQKMV